MTSLNRQDRDLHHDDGSHRSTPSSTSGHQIDLWHRRLTRHMEAHVMDDVGEYPTFDEMAERGTVIDDEPTYKIVRFRFKGENETLVRGLTLEQAQEHCSRDDTHGDGWFDGIPGGMMKTKISVRTLGGKTAYDHAHGCDITHRAPDGTTTVFDITVTTDGSLFLRVTDPQRGCLQQGTVFEP